MVLLPADYAKGANGTDRKPPLYVTVRVIKFLPDRRDLCTDERKKEGLRKVNPYHPNANENLDLEGELFVIEDGCGAITQIHHRRNWACTPGLIRLMVHGW